MSLVGISVTDTATGAEVCSILVLLLRPTATSHSAKGCSIFRRGASFLFGPVNPLSVRILTPAAPPTATGARSRLRGAFIGSVPLGLRGATAAQPIRDQIVEAAVEYIILEVIIVKASVFTLTVAALAPLSVVAVEGLQVRQLFEQVLPVVVDIRDRICAQVEELQSLHLAQKGDIVEVPDRVVGEIKHFEPLVRRIDDVEILAA